MIVIIEYWQGRRTMVVFPEMPVLKRCVPVCEVLLMNVERWQRTADDQGYRRDKCEDVSDQRAPHRAIMVKRLQDVNERFSGQHERFQDVNNRTRNQAMRWPVHARASMPSGSRSTSPHWTLEHPDLCSGFPVSQDMCGFGAIPRLCISRSQGVGSNVDGGLTTSTWIASQAPCRWTAVSTTGRV